MAIDTSVGEFEYPGEEDVGTPARTRRPGAARPGCGRTSSGPWRAASVGYLIGHWLGNVIASGYTQVQDTGQNDVAIVLGLVVRRRRLDGRHRRPQLPAGQDPRLRALAGAAREELGALLPHDRRPQGRRHAVRGRRPAVPLHGRPAGHAHPHRAAQPHQPRVRSGHLHRHRQRARHDHDDDGLVGRGRAARQLAGPPHDRLTAHGLPAHRGLLLLDLHGGLPGHRERALLRRLPDRLDRLRAPADAGGRRDGFVPRRVRGDRHRHDPGRLQPGRHDHQLPGARA